MIYTNSKVTSLTLFFKGALKKKVPTQLIKKYPKEKRELKQI